MGAIAINIGILSAGMMASHCQKGWMMRKPNANWSLLAGMIGFYCHFGKNACQSREEKREWGRGKGFGLSVGASCLAGGSEFGGRTDLARVPIYYPIFHTHPIRLELTVGQAWVMSPF